MSDMVAREWAIFGGAMGGSLDKDSGNTVLDDVAKSASIVRPGNVLNFLGAPSVTVVIPAKNEALNLPHVLPKIPSWVAEVILVDGKSTDRTVEVARSLRPDIKVVGQDRPGKGAALRAGFAAATGDALWQYKRKYAEGFKGGGSKRNAAIFANLIIDNSADGYVYAVDITTGKQVWETKVTDWKTQQASTSGGMCAPIASPTVDCAAPESRSTPLSPPAADKMTSTPEMGRNASAVSLRSISGP